MQINSSKASGFSEMLCQMSRMFTLSFISARLSHLNIALLLQLNFAFSGSHHGNFSLNRGSLEKQGYKNLTFC